MKVSAVSFSFLFIFIFSIFALTPAVAAGPDLSIGIYGGAAGGSLSCDDCEGLDVDRASLYGVKGQAFLPLTKTVSFGAELGHVSGPAANIKVDGENVADLRSQLTYLIPMAKLTVGKISFYGGAGVGYSRSRYFDEELSEISTRPALVAKAGGEYMLVRHVGLFADWHYSRVTDYLSDDDERFGVKHVTSGVVGGIAVHF